MLKTNSIATCAVNGGLSPEIYEEVREPASIRFEDADKMVHCHLLLDSFLFKS